MPKRSSGEERVLNLLKKLEEATTEKDKIDCITKFRDRNWFSGYHAGMETTLREFEDGILGVIRRIRDTNSRSEPSD